MTMAQPLAGIGRGQAVLVGVQLPGETDEQHEADLCELERLVRTLGYDVKATVTQRRDSLAAAAVLGEGKLMELAELTGGKGVVPSGATPRKSKARDRDAHRDPRDAAAPARNPVRIKGRPGPSPRWSSSTTRSRRARRATSSGRRARRCSTGRGSSSTSSIVMPGAGRRGRRWRSPGSATSRRGCARSEAAASASTGGGRARRPSSSTVARSATASPSCGASSPRSRRSTRAGAPCARASFAWRSSATPTPASRRSCARSRAATC